MIKQPSAIFLVYSDHEKLTGRQKINRTWLKNKPQTIQFPHQHQSQPFHSILSISQFAFLYSLEKAYQFEHMTWVKISQSNIQNSNTSKT